ncbi:MAG: ATP-binding protein [Clostridia bacterium]|nr:ATP-binding protein [Clostridia bacterium]
MGYSKEIYDKAFKLIADSKKEAERKFSASLEELRGIDTEFYKIELKLAALGSEIIGVAMSGDSKRLEEIQAECDKLNAQKAEKLRLAGLKKPGFYCEKCKDSGYFEGSLCSCVKDVAKRFAYEELSKSLPLNDCSFDNFDLNYYPDSDDKNGNPRKRATAILSLCKQFVDSFPCGRSLLFIGGAGLGKTHLSLSIVREISAKGYGVVYGSAQNLFGAAEKEHFSFSGDSSAEDSLLQCDLLVIDDLGTEFYSSFAASLFYNIINSRMLSGKPTVINTNLSFDELEKRYSPRITSRFIGAYDMKNFIGLDIRQKKALQNK